MARIRLSARTRALVREIAIIVLGVLIALAIGEVADAVRHRVGARRALAAIRADIADNTSPLEVREVGFRCARDRLTALGAELERARVTGRLRDLAAIGATGGRTYRTGAWDRAVGNGDTLYMDPATVATLADYFDGLSNYRTLSGEALTNWARLSALEHVPGPIDENTLSAARITLGELRIQMSRAEGFAAELFRNHRQLGVPVVYLPFNGRPFSRAQLVARVRASPLCRPLVRGPAPAPAR